MITISFWSCVFSFWVWCDCTALYISFYNGICVLRRWAEMIEILPVEVFMSSFQAARFHTRPAVRSALISDAASAARARCGGHKHLHFPLREYKPQKLVLQIWWAPHNVTSLLLFIYFFFFWLVVGWFVVWQCCCLFIGPTSCCSFCNTGTPKLTVSC